MADVLKKVPVREQDPKVRATNFEEVCLGYNQEEAMEEAQRCLGCKKPKCVEGCPVSINIPGFIEHIKDGNIEEAYKVIGLSSALPAICGRVCPQESQCEGKCIRGIKGEPISIGKLERFVADWASEHGIKPAPAKEKKNKKVAVIGSGPAGLTCAGDLAKMGYDVTIFEALHEAGGVLVYGIPEFRLPKTKVVAKEIENVKSLGVKIETNVVIGKSTTIDELMDEEGFDAVFIGSGAGLPKFMGIPGEQANGVFSANEYLTRSNLMKAFCEDSNTPIMHGKKVAVVGGGNVAMDCTRSAIRLGAKKVGIAYRRRQTDMTALPEEVEGAIAEGAELYSLKAPHKIEADENGNVTALWVEPQIIGPIDAWGRARPIQADVPLLRIPCDIVVVAIGQGIETRHFEEAGLSVKRGTITAMSDSEVKDVHGVFAGGDCVTGPATVIRAIAAGKVAAANIDIYLGFNHKIESGVVVPEPRIENKTPCGRVTMMERNTTERKKDFNIVENGMTCKEANQEAHRCLRCDRFGYGVFKGGRVEEW